MALQLLTPLRQVLMQRPHWLTLADSSSVSGAADVWSPHSVSDAWGFNRCGSRHHRLMPGASASVPEVTGSETIHAFLASYCFRAKPSCRPVLGGGVAKPGLCVGYFIFWRSSRVVSSSFLRAGLLGEKKLVEHGMGKPRFFQWLFSFLLRVPFQWPGRLMARVP